MRRVPRLLALSLVALSSLLTVSVTAHANPFPNNYDSAVADSSLHTFCTTAGFTTDWTPVPGATVARPAEQPAKTPIFFAFSDGLWLQGSQDEAIVGTIAGVDDLGPTWQTPGTLDELCQVIKSAR